MKLKILAIFLILSFCILNQFNYSQETKSDKKALDAFISATTKSILGDPIADATIIVEQIKPIGENNINFLIKEKNHFDVIAKTKYKTNIKGEFSIKLTDEQMEKLPDDFQLKFVVKPHKPEFYKVMTNTLIMETSKENGPVFDFVLTYQKDTKTNKGAFIISPNIASGK